MQFELLPRKKIGKIFLGLGIFLFPLFSCLYIVSIYSSGLISEKLSLLVLLIAVFALLMLIVGIVFIITGKDIQKKKLRLPFKIILGLFAILWTVGGYTVVGLLYWPGTGFKNWLITTAMTTMNHQYLATWFYDTYDINQVLAYNYVVESGEDTDPNLIEFSEPDFSQTTFKNEYEKAVLTKDKDNDLYKIIDIKTSKYKGKMAVIYDPSKVKLGLSKGIGTSIEGSYGEYITEIAKRYNAVLATNASGFYDPDWNSRGGVPHGPVIADGKLVTNFRRLQAAGGLVGFDKDNKLILSRMTAEQALKAGIRDAVDFGPFLIVNGKPSFVKGNGGWGDAPRTAIGQREDGIVLLLVIDGRQTGSIGADMVDLAEIMLNYGAINAANMDGGTSTAMELNGDIISNPRNGAFKAKTRPVPNAWIVVR